MKIKTLNLLGALTVTIGLLTAQTAPAKDSSQAVNVKQSLTGVSALELPAKAADLVAQASDKNKESLTVAVVRAVIGSNPSAAPAVVGAIARTTPSMASVAATTA